MLATPARVSAPTRGRPLPIGDHFFAHSFRARDFGGLMDPLLMVDHFWMRADTFGAHRHEGISALTYVFPDSASAHHNIDSLGNDLPIEPGDLHWFAAGHGAEHHEFPATKNATVHALQVFVDLPAALKDTTPFALHLGARDVPLIEADGVRVRVVAGTLNGVSSPLRTPQPFWLFDGHLEADAAIVIPMPIGWGAWLYAVDGGIRFGDATLAGGCAVALRNDLSTLSIAGAEGGHFVLMAGMPQHGQG